MAEYIERESLMKELSESVEPFNTGSVFRTIRKRPAADVAPVVHGRWIKNNIDSPLFFVCDQCKTFWCNETKYCPGCGAKMEGE